MPKSPSASSEIRFGVISDVQYADTPDGTNFAGTTRRHFRGALDVLERAVDYWNRFPLQWIANLGDTIDGRCVRLHQTQKALDSVLAAFAGARCPKILHLIGNHDLYNFDSRDELDRNLRTRGPSRVDYQAFSASESLRVVILDPYRVSLLWPRGHPLREEAREILAMRNPNDVETSGHEWFAGLHGTERRFVPFNGALGEEQRSWLREELERARQRHQRLLLLTHVPLHPGACDGTTMAWDFEETLELFDEFAGVVAAVLAGHDHKGGYACDRGVHHITLKSPLNRGAEGSCFGQARISSQGLELRGPRLADLVDAKLLDLDPQGPWPERQSLENEDLVWLSFGSI